MRRLRRPRSPVHLLRQVSAGLLAVLALVLALRPPAAAPGPASTPASVAVVVAARDLAAGAVLAGDELRIAELPVTAAPAGAATDVADLAGQVLAGPLRRGEPVTDVRLVGAGLWSQVPPGQVAAPVRLADLAVATLLRAGDRVDVLATTAEAGVAEVVASGALVLSAPSAGPANAGSAGQGSAAVGSADQGGASGLLVLAVSSETAARLAAAAANATLTVTFGPP